MKKYIKPEIRTHQIYDQILASSKPKWNDVSSYGFGDKDDYDRNGDDNWDHDWSWDD